MNAFRCASLGAIALSLGACLSPRSAGLGIPARALAPGTAELGIAVGGAYQASSTAPQDNGAGGMAFSTTTGMQLPSFEANAQLGLTEAIGANLHASSAGLQPGLKIAVLKEPFELSLLPAVGAGFYSASATTTTSAAGTTTTQPGASQSSYDLVAGLRILLGFPIGLYAGVGYDFEYLSQRQQPNPGAGATITVSKSNNLCGAVGYELKLGPFAIRPEIAAVFTAVAKNTSEDASGNRTAAPDSTAIHLFPNVVVAVAAEKAPPKAAAPAP